MYVLKEESKLVKLTDFHEEEGSSMINAKATEVVHLGVGLPFGGRRASMRAHKSFRSSWPLAKWTWTLFAKRSMTTDRPTFGYSMS